MKTILLSVLVLGIMGGIFGAILAVASKVFHVEVDPKEAEIRECLGGANCGGCGYPGCDGYAKAVASGSAPANKCVAAGPDVAKKIAEIMGTDAETAVSMKAFVRCSGSSDVAKPRFNYNGPDDCLAAMLFGGKSNKACTFACIGFGNCVKACKFDAIHIENGVAKVDRGACVGCGACAETCPKSIIALIPETQKIMPTCLNKDKGAAVMKFCSKGCIGCGKCSRECPENAIEIKDNIAVVDIEKCIGCGHCAEVCPRHIISLLN